MPIGRIRNTDSPDISIRNTDIPVAYSKFGAILTPGTEIIIEAGTPIGLLLTLTYAKTFSKLTAVTFIGEQPTARIRNID